MSKRTYNLSCKFCPSSDAVTHYPDDWYKCYSCNKWWPGEKAAITNIINFTRNVKPTEFPKDFTLKIPEEFRIWWRQYQIEDSLIEKHSWGWSEERQRIIIPVSFYDKKKNDLIEYWIERAVYPWQLPKYMCPKARKYNPFIANHTVNSHSLVLVEDPLSALKIAKAGYNCWAILGIGNDKLLPFITERPEITKIVLWLDGDKAGRDGAKKLYSRLSSFIDCNIIIALNDPKDFDSHCIKTMIENHL